MNQEIVEDAKIVTPTPAPQVDYKQLHDSLKFKLQNVLGSLQVLQAGIIFMGNNPEGGLNISMINKALSLSILELEKNIS